jgi:hypothetical protein
VGDLSGPRRRSSSFTTYRIDFLAMLASWDAWQVPYIRVFGYCRAIMNRIEPPVPGVRTLLLGVVLVLGALFVWLIAAVGTAFGIMQLFMEP